MQTHPHFLALLHTALQHDSEDAAARSRLIPRHGDGSFARPHLPEPGVIPRRGAVLLALYAHQQTLFVPLTVRSSALRHHRGEIALPGGAIDASDTSPIAAALREAHEEIDLDPKQVQIWGTLSDVYIRPSNFLITPVVGWLTQQPLLHPAQDEVAEILHLPVFHLLNAQALVVEEWTLRDEAVMVPFYHWQQYKIWGATSIVLSQLAARIEQAQAMFEPNAIPNE